MTYWGCLRDKIQVMLLDLKSNRWSEGKGVHLNGCLFSSNRRSSLFCSAFIDCAGGLRAVAFIKIYSILLPARMQAISHLGSKWRLMSARVVWRAVSFSEIGPILLKAKIPVGSHLGTKRRFMTARVVWRAVSFSEIGSNLLKAKIPVGSHLGTKRRLMSARVILRAVAGCEMTFYRLKVEIWYK